MVGCRINEYSEKAGILKIFRIGCAIYRFIEFAISMKGQMFISENFVFLLGSIKYIGGILWAMCKK
jgi:hypothetical protein